MTYIQKVFDKFISKATFKLRYIILFVGFDLFTFNLWSVTQIKIADKIGKVLKDSHLI
jgi:hypothetical protein